MRRVVLFAQAEDKKRADEKLRKEKKAIQEKADREKKAIGGASWSPSPPWHRLPPRSSLQWR